MYLCRSILLAAVLILKAVIVENDQILADIGADIVADILSILVNRTVQRLGNCLESEYMAPAINYFANSVDNPNTPIVVTTPTSSDCGGRLRIIFLIHGWFWSPTETNIIGIRNEYLNRYDDACVYSVNWTVFAKQQYFSAYCAVPGVAENLANFICVLATDNNIAPESIHVVGHSLGAHIAGIAGYLIQSKCGILGRITGLDPAGPLYVGIALKDRLDASDAIFVDIIHSNGGQFGFLGSCGHVDAHPNCGSIQPGCLTDVISPETFENITSLLRLPLLLVVCHHLRSCDYFEESIYSNQFIAKQCVTCGLPVCTTKSSSNESKVIGEDCTSPGLAQHYVFYTNSTPPYALGDEYNT